MIPWSPPANPPKSKSLGADGALASQLAPPPHSFGRLANTLFGGLFIGTTHFHFAPHAFALHFLFQGPQGLIDVVVANDDLNQTNSLVSLSLIGPGE